MGRALRTVWCRRLVTPAQIVSPAVVEIEDGKVRDVRPAEARERTDLELDGTVVPGLVDLQINGLGSHDVSTASTADLIEVSGELLTHGVTAWLPTIVTGPEPDRLSALDAIAQARDTQREGAAILGAHLEGPWISPKRAGAHRPEWIVDPVDEVVERSLDRHPGLVRVVTLAPEVGDSLRLVRRVVSAGAVASLGHSDADYSQASTAIAAGARMATHTFNAMRAPHHRDPGIVGAVLDDALVTAGLIADGVHLHDAMIRLVFRSKGADRVLLVSDAVSRVAVDALPGRSITEAGASRTATGELAGSLATLDECVRRAVGAWVPLEDAVTSAASVPARLLSEPRGRIEPGCTADMLLMDEATRVQATIAGGRLAWQA